MAGSVKPEENGGSMGVWTAVGIGLGAAVGVATGALAVWTAVGAAAGVALGAVRQRTN